MFDGEMAELLCARLCHDLAGAVGAVTAGAELLLEEGSASPMAAEALDLMASSALSMAARLRFLRFAVGPANQGAAGQARALAEAYLSKGYPQGDWRLDWPLQHAAVDSADHAKLLLNLICLAQECLPRGGQIEVRPGQSALVVARGASAAVSDSAKGLMADSGGGLTPRAAQGAYAALLARRLGSFVEIQPGDGMIAFAVK
jgi:histidine phosphotransferase ChpT